MRPGRWLRLDLAWDDSEWVYGLSPLAQLAWMGEPHLLDAMELLCVGPRTADRLKEAYARWVFGGELPDAPDEG